MTDEQFRVLCAATLDTSSRDALRAEAIRARESEKRLVEALKACLDRLGDLPTTKEDTRLAGIVEDALRKADGHD